MARGYVWRAMEWGSRLSRDRDDKSTLDTVIEAYKPGIDRTLIQQNLRLTVEERVSQLMELQRQADELRKAGATLSRP